MSADWMDVAEVASLQHQGARRLLIGAIPIAIFRTSDASIFAIVDRCPHKGGPLSQGIVHGHAVACPLHNWSISLETGQALAPDTGCVTVIPVCVDGDRVRLDVSVLRTLADKIVA
jgi:nitrite reductase (NADH) small subunit